MKQIENVFFQFVFNTKCRTLFNNFFFSIKIQYFKLETQIGQKVRATNRKFISLCISDERLIKGTRCNCKLIFCD